jgi:hypothetical protein
MNGAPALRAPTFAESAAIDTYKEAVTGALSSADSVSDKIVTAAFSVATAFGAIVALVTPKDSTSHYLVALPFVLLAAAIGAALYAQSRAVPIKPTDDLTTVKSSVDSTVRSKRLWGRVALAALAAGMLVAGGVLVSTYRESTKKSTPTAVQLWLTPAGASTVARACGPGTPSPLKGTVADPKQLAAATVEIKVDATACPGGAGLLVLPRAAIAVARR